ncbi:MAG: deoxynucleotide monophosphate kinase [Luteitalea sp.]|nr:deoxynucleotide monophosphate kinase [Luteitalea sp.]
MKRILIGFTGRIGAGKSTAARALYNRGFTRVRFAGPLKAMMACLGLSEQEVDGSLKEEPCDLLCGKTPRYAMQTIGTEWGRQMIGDDIWIRAFKRAVQDYPYRMLVCDDVRFQNEANAIRELGGAVVRVVRGDSAGAVGHASERQDFLADATLYNAGSVSEFIRDVVAYADTLRLGADIANPFAPRRQ